MKVNAISRNVTGYYNIRDEDKSLIEEIRTVYAYDPESATHLCELTPSYDLRYLHTYIVFTDELETKKRSDEVRDELDQRYCHEDGEDTYMHCSDVRSFTTRNPSHHKECGEFESIEEACEYLNGNWPF